MYKRIFMIASVIFLAGITLLFVSIWVYFITLPRCDNIKFDLPVYPLVVDIDKHSVTVTGNTEMRIGETYIVQGDGIWYSNTTLLAVKREKAYFDVSYFDYELNKRKRCFWVASGE